MKKLIAVLIIAMVQISDSAYAGFFGASNYEECMSDGKVGRTNAEISLLHKNCQKKFPVLSTLSAKKITKIKCDFSDKLIDDFYLVLNPQKKTAIFQKDKKGKITSVTSSKVSTFFEDNEIGNFIITVDYIDGRAIFKVSDEINYASCEEVK